jgi:purine-binding chemotaxis protein CheW
MKEESTNRREMETYPPRRARTCPIDWPQIYQRLEAAQAAVDGRMAPGSEDIHSILRTRARLLATEAKDEETRIESLHVTEFRLAQASYAIESRFICEIQPLRDLTPLPCTPPFVLGLINVRGRILSVIDLRKFLDLPAQGLRDLNKVIVVETDRMELGILAHDVLGARSIPVRNIQSSLPTLTDVGADFLRGVTMDSAAVLDIEKIVSDSRIVVDEDARPLT